MIEFITYAGVIIETVDHTLKRFCCLAILDFCFCESLDELNPRSGGIQSGKNDCGRNLISFEENHENVDEHALVVRPTKDKISNES
jgi:hypothetical protein